MIAEIWTDFFSSMAAPAQIYFRTMPSLDLLPDEIVSITCNSQALLQLHERIVHHLDLIDVRLGWRGHFEADDATVQLAAAAIAQVFIDEVCLVS